MKQLMLGTTGARGTSGAPPTTTESPGRKGGRARAQSLTDERRVEIAQAAARARWSPEIRTATHGDAEHPLAIGGIALPCYVLDDGTRVFSQRGMLEALQMRSRGGEIRRLVSQARLAENLSPEVLESIERPIRFRQPRGGSLAFGYPVTLLVDICNGLLSAREAGILPDSYQQTATRAEIFVRAVAKVGIIALVDEATGYQNERSKEELRALLDRYLRRELAAWAKRFPNAFYQEMHRLRGWDWKGPGNSNSAVAHYTKDLVYARLAPGILAELESRNPRVGKSRKGKHHQLLTEDVGHPALAQHLHAVIAFMRASDSWDDLMRLMDRALPSKDENLQLELMKYDPT